jgi:pyruvate formate lyase activating enzyme
MEINLIREAMFYEKLENNGVQCNLCARKCIIAPDNRGFCGVRKNTDGGLYTLFYSTVFGKAVDPIEKKPLNHFYPGSYTYSAGSIGCNFRCKHCQNWSISQDCLEDSFTMDTSPDELVERALLSHSRSISWTYNEPAIWHEYTYECAKLAKAAGIATVYVTNGYMTPESLRHIAPYLTAANIDIKAFTEKFYDEITSAKLAPVLDSCILAKELGIHIEITNLVIPEKNDSPEEIRELSQWVYKNLGPDTPLHFTRFQPLYQMEDLYWTPIETLIAARKIAVEEGMNYVYIGNVPGQKHNNTFCPECGKMLISRGFFEVEIYEITPEKTCPKCGANIPIVGEYVSPI